MHQMIPSFSASSMALQQLLKIVVSLLLLHTVSGNKWRSQMASMHTTLKPMYSASHAPVLAIFWLQEYQVIASPSIMNKYLLVDYCSCINSPVIITVSAYIQLTTPWKSDSQIFSSVYLLQDAFNSFTWWTTLWLTKLSWYATFKRQI